jgi:hypothetical protein
MGESCAGVAREKKMAHAEANSHRMDVQHFITLSSLGATTNDLVCEAEGTPD